MSAEVIKLTDFLPFMAGMSEEQRIATHKKDEVEFGGRKYLISTVHTFDHGPETMIFSVKANGEVDYFDIYAKRYDTMAAAHANHAKLLADIPGTIGQCHTPHADVRVEEDADWSVDERDED